MRGYGSVTSNDLEMLLLAFANNRMQYFSSGLAYGNEDIEFGNTVQSRVIKLKQTFNLEEKPH